MDAPIPRDHLIPKRRLAMWQWVAVAIVALTLVVRVVIALHDRPSKTAADTRD
ncbi:hypothetical protein GCM10012275_48790 [Longimycelium tulufanense]|uniref:Uncharacterized protein n=1 Tax=Longimycelium tulufanense TaxID=907463 RepID=A0A8J3CC51_9PSEU|nr:hypothetical protein GCM10012275_48790 [Longimycelium tulufanense]